MSDPYAAWCEANACDHGHCPEGCSKPQPILLADGRLVCGRCLVKYGEAWPMIPCRPDTCDDHPHPSG